MLPSLIARLLVGRDTLSSPDIILFSLELFVCCLAYHGSSGDSLLLLIFSDVVSVTHQESPHYITKTCPCNEHPLTPHFYIVKLGFTGVYIIFLFLLQNIGCGYSLEPRTHNLCFEQKNETLQKNYIENYHFYCRENRCKLHGRDFVMKFVEFVNTSSSIYHGTFDYLFV